MGRALSLMHSLTLYSYLWCSPSLFSYLWCCRPPYPAGVGVYKNKEGFLILTLSLVPSIPLYTYLWCCRRSYPSRIGVLVVVLIFDTLYTNKFLSLRSSYILISDALFNSLRSLSLYTYLWCCRPAYPSGVGVYTDQEGLLILTLSLVPSIPLYTYLWCCRRSYPAGSGVHSDQQGLRQQAAQGLQSHQPTLTLSHATFIKW